MSLRSPFSGLSPAERARLIYTMVGFMCVASSALVGRTVGDALFLSHYSTNLLSYMYLGTALVVTAASYTCGLCAPRMSIDRLIVYTCAVLIVLVLGLRLALETSWEGVRILAYLLADLIVNVPMMLFWSFAALMFNPREAKRLFGFVGAGGTFACILAGFVIRPFVAQFGMANLLLLVALFVGGFLLVAWRLSHLESARFQTTSAQPQAGPRPSSIGYYAQLIKSCQIRNLVLLVIAATVSLTLIDYQFKAGARTHYQGADLAAFFGSFYAFSNVAAIFIQIFLVHRIFRAGGVLLGLSLLPAGLLIASVGTAVTAGFAWMVGTKFTVQILAFTIDSAALQMLYLGVQKQSRSQARAFVDGIGKPMSMAATGVLLVGAARLLPLHFLAVGGAVASLLWLILTRSNYRAYVSALVDSLGARRFDLSQETAGFHDRAFESHLRQALTSASDDEIAYLLGILPEMEDIDWTPEFRSLLQRNDPNVKIAALRYLQEKGAQEDLSAILLHTKHGDPNVCAAAIYAAVALGGQDAVEEVEQGLQDARPIVRSAAVANLINSGDLDRLLSAGVVLKEMLQSEDAAVRIAAADALSHIRHSGLTRPVLGLLQDPDQSVRLAAIEACRSRPSMDLMPGLVPLLADPEVANAAADALSEFGPPALDHLVPYLQLSHMEGAYAGAFRIPDILVRIGHPKALPALLEATQHPDLQLRTEAIRAYSRLAQTAPALKPHLPDLLEVANREISTAVSRRQALQKAQALPGAEMLCDALQEDYTRHLRNAFSLLDAATPELDMDAIYLSLTGDATESRANALEILDNVLKGEMKTSLLGLLEPSGSTHPDTDGKAETQTSSLVAEDATEWMVAGTLYALASNISGGEQAFVCECLLHSNPVVRETALYALEKLGTPQDLENTCTKLAEDPDAKVRRLVRSLSSS